jgi:hypothetical protein
MKPYEYESPCCLVWVLGAYPKGQKSTQAALSARRRRGSGQDRQWAGPGPKHSCQVVQEILDKYNSRKDDIIRSFHQVSDFFHYRCFLPLGRVIGINGVVNFIYKGKVQLRHFYKKQIICITHPLFPVLTIVLPGRENGQAFFLSV